MVTLKQKISHFPDGTVDIESWLNKIAKTYQLDNIDILKKATTQAQAASKGLTTFYGQPCIEQGLEMAEILLDLNLDLNTVAAAILLSSLQQASLNIEQTEAYGEDVPKLLNHVLQMKVLEDLQKFNQSREHVQIDRLRKLFLAMVSDIRAVLIKLAERTCIMRSIKNINRAERKRIAQETMDIYAPLANRLGIGQLKWELEDMAFHYINPEAYKKIAEFIAERRIDREARIEETIERLKTKLRQAHITHQISGRAKHIYSIYLKTQRKLLDYKNIYDYSAIRVLVPSIDDCYGVLGIVHTLWEPIPEEFDDYISRPKPNGYRSIHTAVIGPHDKNLEIQIRTSDMHNEAEHGIAAHWVYKENKVQSGYEAKITYLRQLLAWHKEISIDDTKPEKKLTEVLDDRVYVFTPAGDIMDLPLGATPIDFAYHIHSELGHRCRGAKVHGSIVPLTYQLKTGDKIDIITTPNGTPSRDWLNKHAGYVSTSRARAKISHWFKQQDVTNYIETGKSQLEKEISKIGAPAPNLEKIATRLNFKNDQAMFAAIGHGSLKIAQVLQILETNPASTTLPKITTPSKDHRSPSGLQIDGVNNLLVRIARCCKPIPGDNIIGFITQGRGVSIHREDCNNIAFYQSQQDNRLVKVNWQDKQLQNYYVDLHIHGEGKELLKEITSLLISTKIDLLALNSTINKKNNTIHVIVTIQIDNLEQLSQAVNQLRKLPHVMSVKRAS